MMMTKFFFIFLLIVVALGKKTTDKSTEKVADKKKEVKVTRQEADKEHDKVASCRACDAVFDYLFQELPSERKIFIHDRHGTALTETWAKEYFPKACEYVSKHFQPYSRREMAASVCEEIVRNDGADIIENVNNEKLRKRDKFSVCGPHRCDPDHNPNRNAKEDL